MRVLVVSNFYPPNTLGGYEIGCSQVVYELARQGHDVLVMTSKSDVAIGLHESNVERSLELSPVYDSELMRAVSEETRHMIRSKAHFLNATNLTLFLERIAEFKPDILYFWNLIGVGGWALMISAQKLRIPWVMHLMDNVPNHLCTYGYGLERQLVRTWERLFVGRYIACSERVTQEISIDGPDIRGMTEIIPNWLSRDNYTQSEVLPQRAPGDLRIVFAGTVAAFKGVDIVIQASHYLKQRGIAHKIDIFGRIDQPELLTLADRLALQDTIRFHGPIGHSQLIRQLSSYDIFFFPTWDREPMAFAPIEAMAFGCLVLTTEVNGNAEWFVHGVHCWKAPRDALSMAGAIEFLASKPALMELIAENGRRLSRSQLSIEHISPRINQVLNDVVAKQNVPAITDVDEIRRLSRLGTLAQQIFQARLAV